MLTSAFVLALAAAAANEPAFQIRVLTGASAAGTQMMIAQDGTITIGDKTIAGGSWYSIRRTGTPRPPWPSLAHAEFGSGDRLVGSVAGADGDAIRLTVALPGLSEQELRFPLSAIRVLWLVRRPVNDPELLAAPRSRDVLLFRNGDVAKGSMVAISSVPGGVRYETRGSEQQVDLSKVAAVGFNTDLARVRRPKGSFYRVTLANGSRLTATTLTFDGIRWVVQTAFKESLKVPGDQVVAVDVEQGQAVHLCEQKPAHYRYEPFEAEHFAWALDRNVLGRALILRTADGDSTFDRGIGLHSECTVTYSLAGKYRRFECEMGLDARDGVGGDAVVEVQLDGRAAKLGRDGRLTSNDDPLPVTLDVVGVKELTIRVRRGRGGHVGDVVNLVEARLIP